MDDARTLHGMVIPSLGGRLAGPTWRRVRAREEREREGGGAPCAKCLAKKCSSNAAEVNLRCCISLHNSLPLISSTLGGKFSTACTSAPVIGAPLPPLPPPFPPYTACKIGATASFMSTRWWCRSGSWTSNTCPACCNAPLACTHTIRAPAFGR
jgi:hypothetical protein